MMLKFNGIYSFHNKLKIIMSIMIIHLLYSSCFYKPVLNDFEINIKIISPYNCTNEINLRNQLLTIENKTIEIKTIDSGMYSIDTILNTLDTVISLQDLNSLRIIINDEKFSENNKDTIRIRDGYKFKLTFNNKTTYFASGNDPLINDLLSILIPYVDTGETTCSEFYLIFLSRYKE